MQAIPLQAGIAIEKVCFSPRTQCRVLSKGKQNCKALSQDYTRNKEQGGSLKNLPRSPYPAQSLPPLNKAEEFECFVSVQDLFALEKKKEELENELGRPSSYAEWADYVGCSVCRLYARIGKARSARRKMISANLPLVSSIAKEFHGRGLSHQELCQEGAKALMKSTEKFDISHNAKFSTYSYFWIRERMSAAVQKFQSIWIVGKSLQRKVAVVLRCRDEFCKINGRYPSMDELSAASNIDKVKIRQVFFALRSIRTRFGSVDNDECIRGKEVQASENDSPWRILRMRYGLYEGKPLSLFQIAGLLNITHETVRRTERNAFAKVKRSAMETGLKYYLSWMPNSNSGNFPVE